MAGITQTVSTQDLQKTTDFLNSMAGMINIDVLEGKAAAVIESQTRRRISDEKTDPDGKAWADWSPAYAKTRHGGHSLLQNTGSLLDDIFHDKQGGNWVVGSSLIYAAIQDQGGDEAAGHADIPARRFVGLSVDNTEELDETLYAYLVGLYQ